MRKDTRNYGKFHPRFAKGGSVEEMHAKQRAVENIGEDEAWEVRKDMALGRAPREGYSKSTSGPSPEGYGTRPRPDAVEREIRGLGEVPDYDVEEKWLKSDGRKT